MERGRGRRGRARKYPRLTTNAEHYDMNDAGKPHQAPAVLHQSSTFLPHPADSSDEDEDAQFRREAAEMRQRAALEQLPAGINQATLNSAIKQLCKEGGLQPSTAESALLATAEQHANWTDWFNAAMIWLALRQEDQEEAGKMKQAMEESLRHIQILREEAAATDPPLTNLSEERLRRRFKGSAVLRYLDAVMPASVLFSDAAHLRSLVKFKLVELLRLEEQCSKWYPAEGTCQYWDNCGKRVAEQLSATRESCSQVPDPLISQPQQQVQQQQQTLCTVDTSKQPAVQQVDPAPHQQQLQLHVQQQQEPAACSSGSPKALIQKQSSNQQVGPFSHGSRGASAEPSMSAGGADGGVAGAADAGGALKRSTRKRQLPSRYRSPTPESKTQSKTPEALHSSGMPAGAACTATAAAAVASADVGAAAAGLAGCSSYSSSASEVQAQAAGAACASTSAAATTAVVGGHSHPVPAAGDAQQHRPHQVQQIKSTDAVVMQRLSQLLEAEFRAVQEVIYSMPKTAGALPDIFKQQSTTAAGQDGHDSDLEVVDEVDTAAIAAAAAAKARQTAGSNNSTAPAADAEAQRSHPAGAEGASAQPAQPALLPFTLAAIPTSSTMQAAVVKQAPAVLPEAAAAAVTLPQAQSALQLPQSFGLVAAAPVVPAAAAAAAPLATAAMPDLCNAVWFDGMLRPYDASSPIILLD